MRCVVSLPKKSLGKLVTDFSRPSKLLILEGTFALAKFRCASWSGSGDHFGYFEKHSCSVHFCLMNLVMINQTAQCLNTDDVSSSLRSEKEIFGIRK